MSSSLSTCVRQSKTMKYKSIRQNISERLPEKPHSSMNWPPVTMLNVTENNAKNENNERDKR